MAARAELEQPSTEPLPGYRHVLLAADSSDHANHGSREAVALARLWAAQVTGAHVYAAKMHDVRFRQMEGGLPEQFREEQELERQRDVHDDLITRGLSIITDSYLDQVERTCLEEDVDFTRCSLEGKNYRELVNEANSGNHDLLVLGALGLGAVQGGRLGSVCQRVVRRADIDTLVIKDPGRRLAEGPVVVAVDGSAQAYGGLLMALALAAEWRVPVKVVAAFDPYYHYVAFNRIAGVLSEEAGKVFRFKDQEKLHEEIIDSGLAKIYEGHLQVAESIAAGHGMAIETRLLDRKPHDAIERYLREVNPSLLVIGKLGIHADSELDIGGNAENLLRNVDCAVLLSQRQHRPAVDQVAEVTTSWTNEAEQRMQNVPSFVRDMARMAILRYAQERGHTVITERIVEEATASLMPGHAEAAMGEIVAAEAAGELGRRRGDDALGWSDDARALLQSVDDPALRGNLAMRAEKKARVSGSAIVERAHLASFVSHSTDHRDRESALHWQAALDKGGTSVDETAEKISDADIAEDSVAIQLPVKLPEGTEKPYFAMGDAAHPVNVWQWKSGTTDAPQSITLLNGRGIEDVETRDAAQAGIRAQGTYERGTWRVVVKRGLSAGDPEQDIQFVECAFIPVAFAAWDGSNSESGSRHALTTWYWLLLKPAPGNTPLLAAVAAFVLILLAEIGWARSASRKPEKVRGP